MSPHSQSYRQLTARNHTLVPEELQARIRETRLLIAGCGVGSTVAEAALRLGFCKITLVDADTVETHNLNRQNFRAEDVGRSKVHALTERLRSIHPGAEIRPCHEWLGRATAPGWVAEADLVVDTIDLLSLDAMTTLHDECRAQNKPLLSGFNCGWGAALLFFPPGNPVGFRELFGLPSHGSVEGLTYFSHFFPLLNSISDKLNPVVVEALKRVFEEMREGRPCPAPQLSVASSSLAGLIVTALAGILAGKPPRPAPELLLLDLEAICSGNGVPLLSSRSQVRTDERAS